MASFRLPALSVAQIRKLENRATMHFGIPSLLLMERAGAEAARKIQALFLQRKLKKKVCIVCGYGNNGGDGFVIARYLFLAGCRVTVILVNGTGRLKGNANINFQIITRLQVPVLRVKRANTIVDNVMQHLSMADLLVDAIFGIGFHSKAEGVVALMIEAMNASRKPIVAIDVPSGLNADTGEVDGIAVKANITLTMAALKKGFQRRDAREYLGSVCVLDIGIPK